MKAARKSLKATLDFYTTIYFTCCSRESMIKRAHDNAISKLLWRAGNKLSMGGNRLSMGGNRLSMGGLWPVASCQKTTASRRLSRRVVKYLVRQHFVVSLSLSG